MVWDDYLEKLWQVSSPVDKLWIGQFVFTGIGSFGQLAGPPCINVLLPLGIPLIIGNTHYDMAKLIKDRTGFVERLLNSHGLLESISRRNFIFLFGRPIFI